MLSFEDFEKFDAPLPAVLKKFCMLHKGLIVVTGPTGSGKSTTLASMVNYINENRDGHIITIEDPIEYYHAHKRCVVTQREVHVAFYECRFGFEQSLRAHPGAKDSTRGLADACVTMAGFELTHVKTDARGNIDVEDLRGKVDGNTAALMLTNPSTLGLFDENIEAIRDIFHGAGALRNVAGDEQHVRPLRGAQGQQLGTAVKGVWQDRAVGRDDAALAG